MKAIWNGVVVAESDDTVVVEGNHYFPESALRRDFFTFSNHKTLCAWTYADPRPEAEMVRGRVAFWKGVTVV